MVLFQTAHHVASPAIYETFKNVIYVPAGFGPDKRIRIIQQSPSKLGPL